MANLALNQQRCEFGMIMMAVDNLAEKCRRRLDPEMADMDLEEKLHVVQVMRYTILNRKSNIVSSCSILLEVEKCSLCTCNRIEF